MVDRFLRPLKDRLLVPAVSLLARRVSPNAITLAGFLFGVATAVAAALGSRGAALAFWVVNRIFDGLDGAVARAASRQSDSGGYLDIVLDFLVYAGVPLALALGSNEPVAWVATATLLAAFYVNAATWMYLSALIEKRGRSGTATATSVPMPGGLVEGSETILFFSLFVLFPASYPTLAFVMAGLTFVGAIYRCVKGLTFLRR
jgi:phosphatidylglycerophosphate synthase